MSVEEGDAVLLYLNEARQYVVIAHRERVYSFNEGIIKGSALVGTRYGDFIETHLGVKFKVVKPSLLDIVYRLFKRKTQVIYPKDAALIALKLGVGPGFRVLEAGTGSGCLTAVLAYLVRPHGKVYTYDIREDFIDLAKRNLSMTGLDEYVAFNKGDIRKGVKERDLDAAVLDMADPWEALHSVYEALKHGGVLACFLPTINQVEKTVEEAKKVGFILVETVELLERRYKVKRGETRPEMRMVGHTGYLIFARKP